MATKEKQSMKRVAQNSESNEFTSKVPEKKPKLLLDQSSKWEPQKKVESWSELKKMKEKNSQNSFGVAQSQVASSRPPMKKEQVKREFQPFDYKAVDFNKFQSGNFSHPGRSNFSNQVRYRPKRKRQFQGKHQPNIKKEKR